MPRRWWPGSTATGARSATGRSPEVPCSRAVLTKALGGRRALTRAELDQALKAAGIQLSALGRTHIVMHAELDGLIVSGPRRGKQFTYMLLEEPVEIPP